jgi:hypothetical protein
MELATHAAKKLTHALFNPQPTGPCCQVGNKQMLALARLTAIFEGALPTCKKDAASPLLKINDNDAPPSVQISFSPPRVINGATPSRVMQPTVTNNTNSK